MKTALAGLAFAELVSVATPKVAPPLIREVHAVKQAVQAIAARIVAHTQAEGAGAESGGRLG